MEKTQTPRILSMAPLFVMGLADNPWNMKQMYFEYSSVTHKYSLESWFSQMVQTLNHHNVVTRFHANFPNIEEEFSGISCDSNRIFF
jgi:hypothetical protein